MDVQKEDMNEDKASRGRGRRTHDDGGSIDNGVMESCCGEGRVWIFLVLGILALVFSAVLTGVYMNVRSLTTSMDNVEVMPSFVPAAAGGLAGLLVLLLFWKRYKVLVYSVLVLCAITVVLCVIAAVLTGTHVLQPLLSVSGCVYNRRDRMCRCATQFRRDQLELERIAVGEQIYLVMQEVSSCGDIEDILPGMLFTMIGIYGVVALVCVVAGVISLLVYKTELRRRYLEDVEDDTCSPPSSPSSSGNYAEHHTMLPSHPVPTSSATTLVNIYTNPNTAIIDDDNTNDDGNTTPSDLIYSPADVPMGYAEACRMRRCQSFSQPRRGMLREGSPGSSTSSQTASLIGGERNMAGTERGPGRLQEHRKKGRRAVTLHGLDREQLLLILSLQMRYLQESDQSAKRDGASNYLNNNTTAGPANGPSQDNGDSYWLSSDQQRRALTPTPRQERLSSSRTTDDDLDYRPAKLARSHTPQPYHFKNSSQYSQSLNNPPQFQQPHLFPPYQQQKQQQQPSQAAHHKDEEEPPTMITYDLRNVTKTGPIVYENIPSAASSLSYCGPEGHSSNSSSLSHCSNSTKLPVRLPQAGQVQSPSAHQPSDPTNQVLILGGNIQGAGKPRNQFSRQTSQASTSSQPSLESSPSDTRRLVPSKEKTPEPGQTKAKGKKKLSKKDKNLKKDDEITQSLSAQPSGLSRTDSNASKGGVVADRWQTLMENGPKQTQTLWENVQRKIVSDPQTPDSTLDQRHLPLPEHPSHVLTPANSSYVCPQITPKHSSFQAVSSQKLSPQIIPNGILKNSSVANYSPVTSMITQNMSQNLPPPLSPTQNMHYPNPNPFHTNQLSTHYHDAFVPVANSSIENYEDIDEVFPSGQQLNFVPSSAQSLADLQRVNAPPKPPRIVGRQVSKFGTIPHVVQSVSESQSQHLRPKSYMNAVDREAMARNSFVDPINSVRAVAQGPDMGHHMLTHLLMEGPVTDNINSNNVMDRPAEDSSHFQTANEYVYTQPHRKPNPSSEVIPASAEYSPGHIYQNPFQHPEEPGQFKKQQRRNHFQGDNIHQPYWSAFQSFGHNHKAGPSFYEYPVATNEICDTDLDDLPRPQYKRQQMSGQLYPPSFAIPPMCQPHDVLSRLSSTRSGSSSSCEPHNTSCTSSERSVTPSVDFQRSLPDFRYQGHNGAAQAQLRGHQPTLTMDRRFCVTQQHQL